MYLYMLMDSVGEFDNGMIVMTRIGWDSVSMKSVRSLSAMWGVNCIGEEWPFFVKISLGRIPWLLCHPWYREGQVGIVFMVPRVWQCGVFRREVRIVFVLARHMGTPGLLGDK